MSGTINNLLTEDWTGRLLIIKPSSLGDIVHALPVLSALRRRCPKASLDWVVRTELAGLFECIEGVNRLLLFDRKTMGRWYQPAAYQALGAFLRQLRQGRYDLVLDLQGLLRSALFGVASGCRLRAGLKEAREGATLFYTHIAPTPSSAHILDLYQELLGLLGVPLEPVEYGLHSTPQARETVAALLVKEGLQPRRFAVLAVGSAHQRKCWPPERFAQVAAFLHRRAGLPVVIAGSAKEQAVGEQIRKAAEVPIALLTGRTTLPQLVALLEQAALVVGNDSGPTHIAAALNIPAVMIFGPTNPARLFPRQRSAAIAAVNPFGRGRSIDNPEPMYRMENISVEQVLEAINSLPAVSEGLEQNLNRSSKKDS